MTPDQLEQLKAWAVVVALIILDGLAAALDPLTR